MPPCALVDRAVFILGGHMGGNAQITAPLDERLHVVALVRSRRLAALPGQGLQQFQRGIPFGRAGGVGQDML